MPRRRLIRRILFLALVAFVLVGWFEARQDPVVRRVTIVLNGLPPGTPPLRLALVSDIHAGNLAMPAARLDRIVDQINAQHADAILLAGDYVNGDQPDSWDFHPEVLIKPLSRLHASMGVYAILGNHDAQTRPDQVEAALAQAHVTVLKNHAVRLGGIALAGMNDLAMRRAWLRDAIDSARAVGGVPVALGHSPLQVGLIPDGVPLVLMGHTHCGQIVLPGWDNSFDLVHWRYRFNPRYICGVVHDFSRTVIVTGGVGAATIPPLRFNAPPDFWVITLIPRG